MFSTHLENFLPFSSNLKLSLANSLHFDQSEIFVIWEGVNIIIIGYKSGCAIWTKIQRAILYKCNPNYGKLLKIFWEREKMLTRTFFMALSYLSSIAIRAVFVAKKLNLMKLGIFKAT